MQINPLKTKRNTDSQDSEPMRISVVIPTFNRVEYLHAAIKSVLDQTVAPAEIIVVDDGSNDGSEAMITREFGDRVQYYFQENHGVSHARNTGIRMASGNWIALLDSDDQWMPEKLQNQIAALHANPDYRFCHTNEIWIRNGKRVNPMNKHEKSGGFIYQKCLPLCAISPSSVLIKRQVFTEIGLFDETLPVCEDYDYWLRFCALNPVLYIESPQVIKRGGHEDQLSRGSWGMDRYRIHALLKILDSHNLSEEDRAATIATFYEKHHILESGAKKHGNNEILDFCRFSLLRLQSIQDNLGDICSAVESSSEYR